MMVNRRTFSAMVASAVAAPRMSFAQAKDRSAFYSGVGGQLTHFEVDFDAASLAKRASVKLPGGIQYAWPHPSRKYLYVATSSGGSIHEFFTSISPTARPIGGLISFANSISRSSGGRRIRPRSCRPTRHWR